MPGELARAPLRNAGRTATAHNIASFIRPGAPGIESIQFRIINIAANGRVVMIGRRRDVSDTKVRLKKAETI